jgi:drug/metabolite transporter superfamily protein YnfA
MIAAKNTIGFFKWVRQNKLYLRFVLPALALCLGYYVLEQVNKRNEFADFRVYYDAAKALRNDTPMYHIAFGVSSGFYKYSPIAAVPFIPLTYLPFQVAAGIYYTMVSLAFVLFFMYFARLLECFGQHNSTGKGLLVLLFLTIVFGADHAERELHLGNVNLFLMLVAAVVLEKLLIGQKRQAGLLLGIVLLFKPHFLILLPYAVVKKQWQFLAATFLVLVLGFLVLAPFVGWEKNLWLYTDWFQAMGAHNVKLERSPNTIYGLVNNGLNNGQWKWPLLVFILAAVAGGFWIWLRSNNKKNSSNAIDGVEFSVLLALIPTLSHTDTEHFMFSIPCVMYVFYMLINKNVSRHKWSILALMGMAFIPFCLNSPEIVGRKLQHFFDEGGGLGLANLLIISAAILVKSKNATSFRCS